MQLTEYFEPLIDPLYAILDLALERPIPFVAFTALATILIVAAG